MHSCQPNLTLQPRDTAPKTPYANYAVLTIIAAVPTSARLRSESLLASAFSASADRSTTKQKHIWRLNDLGLLGSEQLSVGRRAAGRPFTGLPLLPLLSPIRLSRFLVQT
jgi:hypothetical protein